MRFFQMLFGVDADRFARIDINRGKFGPLVKSDFDQIGQIIFFLRIVVL